MGISMGRRVPWATCAVGMTGSIVYFHNKHKYEQEMFRRMNELLQARAQLSGVYIHQRQAFRFLWYLQWLVPYHQSIKMVTPKRTRHVGLGPHRREGLCTFYSCFVQHEGPSYDDLNRHDIPIPIECWVDYYYKFGHYPEAPDPELLTALTATPAESEKFYETRFLSIIRYPDGTTTTSTCRSAVMNLIYKERLIREGRLSMDKAFDDPPGTLGDLLRAQLPKPT